MNHSRIGNTHLIIELNLFLKSFQPVWSLSFDWMYLVHFGVFKRLLLAWMKWNGPWKLHHTAVDAITVALKIKSLKVHVSQILTESQENLIWHIIRLQNFVEFFCMMELLFSKIMYYFQRQCVQTFSSFALWFVYS